MLDYILMKIICVYPLIRFYLKGFMGSRRKGNTTIMDRYYIWITEML